MLNWEEDTVSDYLSDPPTPRSIAQLRVLVGLYFGGMHRNEVDELADVANGPDLIRNLWRAQFAVGMPGELRAEVDVWSAGKSSRLRAALGQYSLSPLGRRFMTQLIFKKSRFSRAVGGFVGFHDAVQRPLELFGSSCGIAMRVRKRRLGIL